MKNKIFIFFLVLCSSTFLFSQSKIEIGGLAPEIELPTPTGDMIRLSDINSQLILIDFWGTWCAPCVKEQQTLKKAYKSLLPEVEANQFQILGVSLDFSKENWVRGIKEIGIIWPQVSDLKFWQSKPAENYGVKGLPFNVLVNNKREIIAINVDVENLVSTVKEELKKLN